MSGSNFLPGTLELIVLQLLRAEPVSYTHLGCSDWHSAVNSTWTLVKILRAYPDLSVARLIREKLNEHLAPGPMTGEVEFFNGEGDRTFERPYGWVWLLRLYGEAKAWDDPCLLYTSRCV